MSRDTNLSRAVSHALRHEPWVYRLELDSGGWTSVDALVEALRRHRRWRDVTASDVTAMVAGASKRRYELRDGRIRALYGHSVPGRIAVERRHPPPILFHGTAPAAVAQIMADGLRPMGRQRVHLSTDVETARAVGARRAPAPVVLRVEADRAARADVAFYLGNERTWLADFVPARYITPDPA